MRDGIANPVGSCTYDSNKKQDLFDTSDNPVTTDPKGETQSI